MSIKADITSVDTSATAFYFKPIPISLTKEVYMEFDYLMPEGILAPALAFESSNGSTSVALGESYLNPTSKWTHVYWYWTSTIQQYGKAQYTPTFILIPEKGKINSQVFIDNIKILEK